LNIDGIGNGVKQMGEADAIASFCTILSQPVVHFAAKCGNEVKKVIPTENGIIAERHFPSAQ
jgi:hypothetical protein